MSESKAADPASLDALRARLEGWARLVEVLDGDAVFLYDLARDAIASLEAERAGGREALVVLRVEPKGGFEFFPLEASNKLPAGEHRLYAAPPVGGREAVAYRSWHDAHGPGRWVFSEKPIALGGPPWEPLYAASPAQEWDASELVRRLVRASERMPTSDPYFTAALNAARAYLAEHPSVAHPELAPEPPK